MISKWRKFRNLSTAERRILIRAVALLPLVSIACTFLGFRRVQSIFFKQRKTRHVDAVLNQGTAITAKRIGQLTDAGCRFPLYRFRCLVRSIVLCHLLASQGFEAQLEFGVRKDGKKIRAHAWVEIDGDPLGESANLYSAYTPLLDPTE